MSRLKLLLLWLISQQHDANAVVLQNSQAATNLFNQYMLNVGLLTTVETLMADPATPAIARLAWAKAQEFRRDSPTIAAMSVPLELTSEQIDDLFRAAAKITA